MIQLVLKLKNKTKQKKPPKIGQVRQRGVNWLHTECLCKFGCETIISVKSFRAKYVVFFREPSPQTICVSFVMIWLVVTPNVYTKSFVMGNAKVSKLWRHMLKRHERTLQHSSAGIMTSWHDWHVHFRRYWPCARESYWSPVNSPRKGPVTRSFDVFFLFNVSPNKLLNRHWGCWLVNKPWRSYDVALMV